MFFDRLHRWKPGWEHSFQSETIDCISVPLSNIIGGGKSPLLDKKQHTIKQKIDEALSKEKNKQTNKNSYSIIRFNAFHFIKLFNSHS